MRARAGQQGYAGGFIEHYLTAAIYPEGLTRETQIVLATLLVAGNLVVMACGCGAGGPPVPQVRPAVTADDLGP